MMKTTRRLLGMLVVGAMVFAFSSIAMGEKPLKDYNAIEVQGFMVSPTTPAPDSSGEDIAENIVYQVRRYAQKYGEFDIIIREGSKEIPAGHKTLLIKGAETPWSSVVHQRTVYPLSAATGEAPGSNSGLGKADPPGYWPTSPRTHSSRQNGSTNWSSLWTVSAYAAPSPIAFGSIPQPDP